MSDHGGCRLGNVQRWPVAGPCRLDCGHRGGVLGYYAVKAAHDEARKLAREEALRGARSDGEEARDWDRAHPPFTYKAWLVDQAGSGREHAEAAA